MPIIVRNTGSGYEILSEWGELLGEADNFTDALFGAKVLALENFRVTKKMWTIEVR